MYYVYVLKSLKDNQFYTGMTNDVERRLGEHNAGCNKSTKSRLPFVLIHSERFDIRLEARNREKFLKSGCGREFVKNLIPR